MSSVWREHDLFQTDFRFLYYRLSVWQAFSFFKDFIHQKLICTVWCNIQSQILNMMTSDPRTNGTWQWRALSTLLICNANDFWVKPWVNWSRIKEGYSHCLISQIRTRNQWSKWFILDKKDNYDHMTIPISSENIFTAAVQCISPSFQPDNVYMNSSLNGRQ